MIILFYQWYDVQPMDVESTSKGEFVTYGKTEYDIKTGMVVMYIANNDLGYGAHEFKHAYQFEIGELGFDAETGNGSLRSPYSIFTEREANRRALLFGSKTTSEERGALKKVLPPSLERAKKYANDKNIILRYDGITILPK